MDIFDIIGPVMVGPSSSHTAGAARIGFVARCLLNEKPLKASILLYGSFARTGLGHGTNRALVAGILGMKPDDARLKDSLEIAEKEGLEVKFGEAHLDKAHPNTAIIYLTGESGKETMLQAASVGGGNIRIDKIDGQNLSASGRNPTVVVRYKDVPGTIGAITSAIGKAGYNIFQINLGRDKRGGTGTISMELDGDYVNPDIKESLKKEKGILDVVILQPY